MTRYEIIFNELTEKVETGELTLEDAEVLNDIAYDRYSDDVTEYEESVDDYMTYGEYLESMERDLFDESTATTRYLHDKSKRNKEYNKYDSVGVGHEVGRMMKKNPKYQNKKRDIQMGGIAKINANDDYQMWDERSPLEKRNAGRFTPENIKAHKKSMTKLDNMYKEIKDKKSK